MFFIGIFGIESKKKEIKILENLFCKKCNKSVTGRLIKQFEFFHFFFIPIFKWNEKYYIVCNQCNCIYSISKEKGRAIEHDEDVQITYWDLQEVYMENYNLNHYGERICTNCGRKVEANFKYCPFCGGKI